MEIYKTQDNKVTKYVHTDGSETAIKHSFDSPTEQFGTFSKIINKFNVFISTSVGCPINCKFCYLTEKNVPYIKLTNDEIVTNVIDAITHQVEMCPELKDQYVKLSWMGMGDAFINFQKTIDITFLLINEIMGKELCMGIDSIDISTTMPTNVDLDDVKIQINRLDDMLNNVKTNPLRSGMRLIRIFYSLHSSIENVRHHLIPYSKTIKDALLVLANIPIKKAKIIIHHMILEGINDNDTDIKNVIAIMNLEQMKTNQLRILRYNNCDASEYMETTNFENLIKQLYAGIADMKVQISPGSDVKAACGQFLLKHFEKNNI